MLADSPSQAAATSQPAPASLPRRLYSKPSTHRLVPTVVARHALPVVAHVRYRHDEPARARARLELEYLLGRSPRAHEVPSLVAPYLAHVERRHEMVWRPWIVTRRRIVGADVLRRLKRSGGGAIVNFLHQGAYFGMAASFGRIGLPMQVASNPFFFEPDTPDALGLYRRHFRTVARANGGTVFPARGSYERMRELLHAGELLVLCTDMPGSTPMEFLGRRVLAASGAARLSLETGAPIVPVSFRRHRWDHVIHVEEPIHPRRHADALSLQAAIARSHEPAALAWPEAVLAPSTRWLPADPEDRERFAPLWDEAG